MVKRGREKYIAAASVLVAVAGFVTFCATQIGRWSVWFDESFSSRLIKSDFVDIAKFTAHDVHPPLYYWLLKIWSELFGSSDVALRSFSVFCGAIIIILGFLFVRKLFGKKAGYLALPLLALSPMLLRYGIEMRMYTLVVVIILAQLFVLLKARQTGKRAWWVLYGVLIAAGLYTHYFSAVAVIAQWGWLLFSSPKKQPGQRRGFIWSLVITAVLFAPWLPVVIKQMLSLQHGFWIPDVSFTTLPDYVTSLFFYQTSSATTAWLAVSLMVILVIIIMTIKKSWPSLKANRHFQLVVWMAAAPLFLLLLSLPPLKSSFVDRYVLTSMIFTAILIAVVAASTPRKTPLSIAAYVLTLTAFAYGAMSVVHYGNYNKTNDSVSTVKQLIQQVARASDGKSIPVIADTVWMFYDADQYTSDTNPVYFLRDQADDFQYGSLEMLRQAPEGIADLAKFTETMSGTTVWYVSGSGQATTPPGASSGWQVLQVITAPSPFDGNIDTQAVQYLVK
jgi:uncharacterized membrane protein